MRLPEDLVYTAGKMLSLSETKSDTRSRAGGDPPLRDSQCRRPRKDYAVFERVKRPAPAHRSDPARWASLLEACLPSHLRRKENQSATPEINSPIDRAEIVLAARGRPTSKFEDSVDLMYNLAVTQGRWKAAVWLMKDLVEHYGQTTRGPQLLPAYYGPFDGVRSYDELTSDPISLISKARLATPSQISLLEQPSTSSHAADAQQPKAFRLNVLGAVWRALGAMILACRDGVTRPEILEVLAYLHAQGIMPASIYSRLPQHDETAVQQPPTLHLLSSRILTSLSDAAWRAHEKSIIDETSANGAKYLPLRPEVPGSAYRVHVAGLRSEIWLELVLWACLHGGFVLEGAAILRSVCNQPEPLWKPFAWRSLVPSGEARVDEFEKLDYLYNTQGPKTMDQEPISHNVEGTISSEVVNAYVDAILSEIDAKEPGRNFALRHALETLVVLQGFLDRSGLSLGGGSWDAVMLRFTESVGSEFTRVELFRQLATLAPGFGHEVASSHMQTFPRYMLDGSAAFVGKAHEVLRAYIRAGNLGKTLRVLKTLRDYTDSNKRRSLEAFFTAPDTLGPSESRGLFTSNYHTIEYPAFDPQIPPTILGPLLDLATDAEAYEFGRWLLYNTELDGPLIPKELYNDIAVTSAVIRFASATNDKPLISMLVQVHAQEDTEPGETLDLPQNVLQSFLSAQFDQHRWDAAERILQTLAARHDTGWDIINLAVLSRTIICLSRARALEHAGDAEDLTTAKRLFAAMVGGQYGSPRDDNRTLLERTLTLLAVVAVNDPQLALFCCSVKELRGHFTFSLPTRAFNEVLRGVLDSYGSVAGHRLLATFWPRKIRLAQAKQAEPVDVEQASGHRNSSLNLAERMRTTVELPGQDGKSVVVYGGLRADIITVRSIFRKALEELGQTPGLDASNIRSEAAGGESASTPSYETPSSVLKWCIYRLQNLGVAAEDISNELEEALPGRQSGAAAEDVQHLTDALT